VDVHTGLWRFERGEVSRPGVAEWAIPRPAIEFGSHLQTVLPLAIFQGWPGSASGVPSIFSWSSEGAAGARAKDQPAEIRSVVANTNAPGSVR